MILRPTLSNNTCKLKYHVNNEKIQKNGPAQDGSRNVKETIPLSDYAITIVVISRFFGGELKLFFQIWA